MEHQRAISFFQSLDQDNGRIRDLDPVDHGRLLTVSAADTSAPDAGLLVAAKGRMGRAWQPLLPKF